MKKLLNNPWVVGVLAMGAVLLVARTVLRAMSPGFVSSASASTDFEWDDSESEADENQTLSDAASIRQVVLDVALPTEIPDPFVNRSRIKETPTPEIESVEEADRIKLSAIWEQGGEMLLLLNGRIFRVGDTLGRVTIESASLDGIWLTHWNGRDFVPLGGEFTLVTPVKRPRAETSNVAFNEN